MSDAPYQLYYWPFIPGRGDFVRLVLEEAGAPYVDVARLPDDQGGGIPAVLRAIRGQLPGVPPLAPPILVADDIVLAQVANICLFLARRHGLVPEDDKSRHLANQLQLTIADLIAEVHDTHHPVAHQATYETQTEPAKLRAAHFIDKRMPKFLGYFERVLASSGGDYLLGDFSYVDLSMTYTLQGISRAFPKAFARFAPEIPGLVALRERVEQRPRVAAYLASDRRIAFSRSGIFRDYPELDLQED